MFFYFPQQTNYFLIAEIRVLKTSFGGIFQHAYLRLNDHLLTVGCRPTYLKWTKNILKYCERLFIY